ncbi:MAG: hypothetical protein HQL66_14330, partial [Magnetococcales bacterium]|nr:hypothetical protein [Magnetococcales bacterium]
LLPAKSGAFKRWAEGVAAYARSLRLLREIDYWRSVEAVAVLSLPGALCSESSGEGEVDRVADARDQELQLSPEETATLLAVARAADPPYRVSDLLLAALAQALHALSGCEQTPIMLEGHGREPIVEGVEVSRTVGWFTTVFPFILNATATQTRDAVRQAVREELARVPQRGIGYGILRYLTPPALRQGHGFDRNPRISFNYLGEYGFDPGQLGMQAESDIAPYRSSDRALLLYDLAFNAIVEGGRLHLYVAYASGRFADATIRTLLDSLRTFLL